ncbi:lysine N(6)-hydroxylase/L-ornithine N(5)-oxygenase family protein [Niabella insulamsoli]|uniref:lysine N(6)-hydroxylase/L-ornithine N(5)-oxygenase family protein n=1 Tax=Niabella insulamsoli TaxID=3144874 RepID=UPI0031FE1533
MNKDTIYDIAGIGVGPFNLGLAALCAPIENVTSIFIEQKKEFNWHPGMMIPGTTLQVSYLADLVTLADPSNKFSYLNFLRTQNRLIQFGIHESSYLTRSEYTRYCKWVAAQLPNLIFSTLVKTIFFDRKRDCFQIACTDDITGLTKFIKARHIIMGIGSQLHLPGDLTINGENIIHSSDYMHYRKMINAAGSVALIGSGQSAAEIFYDQIHKRAGSSKRIDWYTQSDRFYAMERSKLAYEMSTPDYIDFFYQLPATKKKTLLGNQGTLYKGINEELINAIYDKLYHQYIESQPIAAHLFTNTRLEQIKKIKDNTLSLEFCHLALDKKFSRPSDFAVFATGYDYRTPRFLSALDHLIEYNCDKQFEVKRNYSVDNNNRIFVQNAELHTHGFNAADLGLGAYRNAVIINTITKENIYPVDQHIAFQNFGL